MGQNGITVSIIVPVFNIYQDYLRTCIESLLAQTLKDIEIILVDDGSSNDCATTLDEFSKNNKQIICIHKKNGGVSSARNAGLEIAQGKYITFIDADDWTDIDTFYQAYQLANEKKVDMICWGYKKEYDDKSVLALPYLQGPLEYYKNSNKGFDPFYMGIIGTSCCKLYLSSLIKGERFDTKLKNGEDVEFNFRIYQNLVSACYINKPFYHYRQLKDSSVREFRMNSIEEYKKTLCTIEKDILRTNEFAFYQAYYSFSGISYLMVVLNTVFSKQNKNPFYKKYCLLKRISKQEPFSSTIKHVKQMNLRLTRKLGIYFAYWHLYLFVFFTIKIKQWLDS